MQYCAITDTILSIVENLDVMEQYIIPHDDDDGDEGEAVVLLAVEDSVRRSNFHNKEQLF